MEIKQNKFMFFANFAETIKELPIQKQAEAYQAICEYGIYGILPEDESLKMMCLMAKASVFKEDGRKNNGGRREGAGRPKNQDENQVENQDEKDKNHLEKNWGGKREGAGRPKNVENQEKKSSLENQINQKNQILSRTETETEEEKEKERYKKEKSYPDLVEVLEYAKGQNDMKGCGGFECSEGDAVRFWLKCQNNHWRENNEYRTPIPDWEKALKYRNDKKYLLWVDVDKVAEYWNILADGYGLGKINSGDITGKKLDNCSKLLVEIICGLIVNPETKDVVMEQLEKREYDLWRWAMYRLDIRLSKSKYLRGETEHRNRLDISFLLNENNFKELVSPNSEKYIDRE